MNEFLNRLFGADRWPTRWQSGNWNEFHGWIYIIFDILSGTALLVISFLIVYYIIKKRSQIPFISIFWLFAAFIFFTGVVRLVNVCLFWWPVFGLRALAIIITGCLSWVTVIALIRNLPSAFSQPTAAELENEVQQRIKMEEEMQWKNRELEDIQQLAHMGSWRYDIQSHSFTASPELHRIFGIEVADVAAVDQFLTVVYPEDFERTRSEVRNALSTGVSNLTVYRIKRNDGQVRVIQTMVEPGFDHDGKPIFLRGTAQDITQIKQAEEILAKRALELEKANAELEIFAYAASHDMQEPLRKIRSFADRVRLKYSETLDDTGREYLEKITGASTRMQLLIDDLLVYSKVVSGTYVTQKVDLNEVVKDVISDLEVTIQEKKATIKVGQLPKIEAIPSQMRQLFQNLFSNSLKFTRADIPPLVNIYSEKGNDGSWKIYVKDNGVGFDEKYVDRIFIVFQRLHGRREYEGTGIGLAVVKKIVERHHGSIEATSAKGEGSVFTLILPEQHPAE